MTKKPTEGETTTPEPGPDAKKRSVEKIDFTKPVAVILYQTESRNNFLTVTEADCENGRTPVEQAQVVAAGLALNQGHTVAVFGPQTAVKVPPKEPQADDMELPFLKATAGSD